MPTSHRVTLIPGDGVGPEVVRSAARIIDAAGRRDRLGGGRGRRRGLQARRHERRSARDTRIDRPDAGRPEGPARDPVGFGEKSANVTLRKLFETYANVRPARELPGVPTRYAGEGVDMIVVRENIEDLYAGIEHMLTPDVGQCLKIISRKGSEKVIRYAFELARREGRAKVTCATKANIMKLTEGLFKARLRGARPGVPGDRDGAPDHRQRRPAAREGPGPVRHHRHDEPQRRHHQRPRVGARRRPRLRLVGELRRLGRDLRGGPRLGPEVRRQGRDQPDRADPQRGDDAPPSRRGCRRPAHRGRGAADARGRPGDDPGPRPPDRRRRRHRQLDERLHRHRDRQPRQATGLAVARAALGTRQRAVGAGSRRRCPAGRTAPSGTPASRAGRSGSTSSSPPTCRPRRSGPISSASPGVPTASTSSRAAARRSTPRSASDRTASGWSGRGS